MRKYLPLIVFILLLFEFCMAQTGWTPVSPDFFPTNASGQIHGISRITQVKFHPTNSSKMYAVSCRGGLFISSNSGTSWTLAPGCDMLPQLRLNSVCVDHTNDQVIYLGTGDANYYSSGNGVYKSTNGGTTFSATSLTGKLIIELLMDPANNNTIIAATEAGIYKSTNAGSTWTLKSSSSLAFRDMVFKANSGTKTLFASTYSELYRSTDMGETWTNLSNGIYIPSGYSNGAGCRVAVTPADSQLVYFAMIAKNGTIFKSTDGGNTFVNVKDNVMPNLTAYENTSTSTGQGDYNCMFNADPVNGSILYFGAHNFWKSTNGGTSWSKMTDWWAILHTDMHWVKVNPYNTSQIWTGNDGGVWMSVNGGSQWTPKSDGIYGYEIYHGNCSPTRRDMFSIGTQDNGELYHSAGTWYTNRGGDWGSQCAFDYRNSSNMVYYYQNDKRRLVNGSDGTYGLPVSSLQDIAFYRGNINLAFAGNLDVYRTTNLQSSSPAWTKITNINKTIKAIHVNLADANKVYVITSDATIYVCTNALAATPVFTAYALPNSTNNYASMTSIKLSPNTLYASLNTRVYRSTDNGMTWTNVSSNLPNINWAKILPDEYFSASEMVFVAGNTSVYYKKNGQTNWTLFSSGLPTRTLIIDFSIYDDGTNQSALRVSEYGRGMWEIPMTTVRNVSSEFSVNQSFPCVGTSVQYSDLSTGNVTSWNWTFQGGTPSSSTLQNPVVTYNSAGVFNTTLQVSDGVTSNSLTKNAYINSTGSVLPLSEGFETTPFPPAGWTSVDDGADAQVWQQSMVAGGFGTSAASFWFDNYAVNVQGKKDEMRTPRFDIAGLTTAEFKFDVAFQPYNTTNNSDTLEVLVSTNCGATFTSVYLKGGNTLATVLGNLNYPFTPTAGQWRTETINLSSFIPGSTVVISFKNRGHYGNNIFIDNVNLTGTLAASAGPDRIICANGNAVIGSSPVSGISYSWSPAAGLTSSTVSNPTASPVATTNYILTATKQGTSISGKDTVVVSIDEVPLSGSITPVSCFGGNNGAIDLSSSGGIAPYSYLWNDNSVSEDRSGLITGNYSVTVTDGNSCSRAFNFNVSQAVQMNVGITSGPSSCIANTGTATAITTGGNGGYSYAWSNGESTSMISNLAPGIYSVTATDINGCTGTASVTVGSSCDVVLNLKVFIEGFYTAPNTMVPVADPFNHPTLCDSVTIELHEAVSPFNLAYSVKDAFDIHGLGTFRFPEAVLNKSYYVVLKHRNSIEIWSKNPLLFNSSSMSFDFTSY